MRKRSPYGGVNVAPPNFGGPYGQQDLRFNERFVKYGWVVFVAAAFALYQGFSPSARARRQHAERQRVHLARMDYNYITRGRR